MKKSTLVVLGSLCSLFLLGLSSGESAPAFLLKNQNGRVVSLAENKGQPVLIYFYPKDETPGCTKEACTLRDQFEKFQKLGAVIYGVSVQDERSHREFRAKHKLPFDLLVDPDGTVAAKYGVGKINGTELLQRKSVLVGPDQKVFRVYEQVDPAQHADQVLADLKALKK